jgi:uncharacterized protein YdiU (UPF0061 family)
METSPAYQPATAFADLGDAFSDPVTAATFPEHRLRFRNQRAAASVGLELLSDQDWENAFARFQPLPRNMPAPRAIRYHGHQFRVYNPDIGDGRGFLFAQMRDTRGRLLDLGTKGSGQTPYSRFGDGRLTLKGAVREILASEMLEAQGVKTSRTLSVFETGESLQRQDEPSPTRSAVLVRLQHAHVRIGIFQRLAFFEERENMARLVDHCIDAYYPHLSDTHGDARIIAFLDAAIGANARLAGQWMAAGFVHGVLNSDNMTVTGESFDYGPWRFLPTSDPGFTAAYFDHQGLYAFGRQPQSVGWNLAQLGASLLLLAPEEKLIPVLETYGARYSHALRDAMFTRLGITPTDLESDLAFLTVLFEWMTQSQIGWSQFFHDWFCGAASAARAKQSPAKAHYDAAGFQDVRAMLEARTPARPERLDAAILQQPVPPSVLIDDVESLWAPIAAEDDWRAFDAKLAEITALRDALDIHSAVNLHAFERTIAAPQAA